MRLSIMLQLHEIKRNKNPREHHRPEGLLSIIIKTISLMPYAPNGALNERAVDIAC